MILKQHCLWASISDQVRSLRERQDVGRALSHEDEDRLLDAIRQSRSPALLPLFILALGTGLRASELRHLRRRDLNLTISAAGIIESGELVASKSKTAAGSGRIVPLTRRACAVLSLWLPRLPKEAPGHYVFPAHKIGIRGHARKPYLYAIEPDRPMGFWKKAWQVARNRAGVDYRWHDARHSFVSRICEHPAVSETTIMALAGHVSKRMMERYSHVRAQPKRAAISTLERADFRLESPPKSHGAAASSELENHDKLLN
jgi:integrase